MRIRQRILCLLLGLLFIKTGCAKRAYISYDDIKPNALVQIKTLSGEACDGEIQEKNTNYLLLKMSQHDHQLTKIKRDEIASIRGRDFEYDGMGNIISEWEIQAHKNNKNLLLYTIGGAGLSFGASFFIGSLIHRGMDNSANRNTILWGTSAAGTTIGTLLFARTGANRDRHLAVEEIREARFNAAKNQFDDRKKKHDLVRQQIEKEKAAREKQEQELRLLQEKVKNKKQN